MRSLHRTSLRDLVADDLDTMPLMNLFVALIPMLLVSAVFLNVTVIDMDAPPPDAAAAAPEGAPLEIAVTNARYVVRGGGGPTTAIPRDDEAAAALAAALAQAAERRPERRDVTVVSQADTRYDEIIAVMDIAREAGLPGVSLRGNR